jgi:hypothetical protein
MGFLPRPLIPLIVDPAERTEDDNKLATTASPATQCHIRRVNAWIGPTPLRPELPVRETKWLCCPMEVTPAPLPNCPLATVCVCVYLTSKGEETLATPTFKAGWHSSLSL